MMLENVLFPVEGNESTAKLADMAGFLKIFNTKTISLLWVGSKKKEKNTRFFEELKQLFSDLGFETDFVQRNGAVADQIVQYAGESGTEFVCFAYKRKSPLKRALLGDVVTDVIRLSNLPVFVYKRPFSFQKTKGVQRVMYATGLSATDIKILGYLKDKNLKADELLLFHAGERAPDPAAEAKRIERAYARLGELEQQCRGAFTRIDKKEAVGASITRAIVSQAKESGVDFIIAGKSDKANAFEKMIGATAESLPRKSPCPVLIIPGIYEGIHGAALSDRREDEAYHG